MAKREHEIGKAGEKLARQILRTRGVRMVEKIGSPVRLVPTKQLSGRPAFYVYFGDKVSGDVTGLLDDGTRVIAETKTIYNRNLRWGDLRTHQPGRLDLNKKYSGVSLLVWVSTHGVFVMDWVFPNEDFKPRKGLTIERAGELDIMGVSKLSKKESRKRVNVVQLSTVSF